MLPRRCAWLVYVYAQQVKSGQERELGKLQGEVLCRIGWVEKILLGSIPGSKYTPLRANPHENTLASPPGKPTLGHSSFLTATSILGGPSTVHRIGIAQVVICSVELVEVSSSHFTCVGTRKLELELHEIQVAF